MGNIVIGDLNAFETNESTTYQAGTETKPNPKKAQYKDELVDAREAVGDAKTKYQTAVDDWEEQKRTLGEQCKANLTQGGSLGATNCNTAAMLAGSATKPSTSGIEQAQRRLEEAKQRFDAEPDTIEVPIIRPWSYKKKSYTRTISAALAMTTTTSVGTRKIAEPFSITASDYDVMADAAHNVVGHTADPTFKSDPEASLPQLAAKIAARAAAELRKSLNQSLLEAAAKTFADAGNEPSKPEYATIDALAFQTAGARLGKVLRRGAATVGEPVTLPTADARVAADECLLVVAANDGADAKITLQTESLSHADMRGKSFAVIEICPDDTPGKLVAQPVSVKGEGKIRWGIYRTALRADADGDVDDGSSKTKLKKKKKAQSTNDE